VSYKFVSDWAKTSTIEKNFDLAAEAQGRAQDFFWPIAYRYISQIPTIFLYAVKTPSILATSSDWIARDGVVPLTWFFLKNPIPPKNLKAKIWVHYSCKDSVPKEWKGNVGVFQFQPKESKIKKDQIFFTGLMSANYIDLTTLEVQLATIRKNLDENGTKIKSFSVFAPPRYFGYGAEHDHNYQFEFAAKIISEFGTNFRVYKWNQFEAEQNFSSSYVVDLNSNCLISDSFCVHHAVARGATFLDVNAVNSAGESSISGLNNHGWVLTKLSADAGKQKEIAGELEDAREFSKYLIDSGLSEIHNRFPWPDWVTDWAANTNE
jgi:hypothetical protein